ncbi:myb-related protein 1-like [Musa acuminata AAA Group]|uniref:myb-related protein 1-like n=1 Tax=Musa acuminata AAA Group TaxID=214697 RepID=UPI0031E2E5F6
MGDPGAASRRKNRLPKGGGESSDLHAAARNGDLTTVESICNANPLAVNTRDRHSRTPEILLGEALWYQIEVQRKLQEQLVAQKKLQTSIKAQRKYLQAMLEKAQKIFVST